MSNQNSQMSFGRIANYRKRVGLLRYRNKPRISYAIQNSDRNGVLNVQLKQVDSISTNSSGLVIHEYTDITPQSIPYNDFSSWANLYDQFRVRAVKLQYFPTFNVNLLSDATSGGPNMLHPLYIVFDPDNATLNGIITTNNQALEYQGAQVSAISDKWSFFHKFKKVSQNGTGKIDTGGWMDVDSAAASQCVSVLNLNSGLIKGNFELGQIVATYYVQFRHRK